MVFNIAADGLEGVGSYRNLPTLEIQTEIGTFLGVTSDQAFNRIVFSHDGCCSRSFAFGDVSFSTSLAAESPPSNGVPEPATLALVMASLLGSAAVRCRCEPLRRGT